MFLKAAQPSVSKSLQLPRAESREALRKVLGEHPHKLELLSTELETIGEDWLLALQGELTKPYFLSVRDFKFHIEMELRLRFT